MAELLHALFYMGGNLVILLLVAVPVVFFLCVTVLYVAFDWIGSVRRKGGFY